MITAHLPGAGLIDKGLADLGAGLATIESLLVSIAAPGLRDLGLAVGDTNPDAELRPYALLAARGSAQPLQRAAAARDQLPSRRAVREVAR